jgi:hypothetical protein
MFSFFQNKHRVPKEFQFLLQSAPIEKWDAQENKQYIIAKFLHEGTIDAWRWMFRHYSKKEIIEVFKSARDLNEKDALFWCHYLKVPTEEVRCLQPGFQQMRKQHWAY